MTGGVLFQTLSAYRIALLASVNPKEMVEIVKVSKGATAMAKISSAEKSAELNKLNVLDATFIATCVVFFEIPGVDSPGR